MNSFAVILFLFGAELFDEQLEETIRVFLIEVFFLKKIRFRLASNLIVFLFFSWLVLG